MIILIQAILGFLKGDSTKSLFPIVEKVAIYEKHKMGNEWYRQRKDNHVCNIVLSIIMFFQSYMNLNSQENVFKIEFIFMIIMVFVILALVNLSLIIHIRKVDRSTSELEMTNYTLKSNFIGIAVGIVFALFTIGIIISYITTTV